MRDSVSSRTNRWCQKAAPACSTTSATSSRNSSSWVATARSASHSFGATSLGTSNSPNQRNGRRPLAESYSQPDSGIATASAYSAQCVAEAIACCQRGVPATGGTPPAYSRHASRSSISTSTLTPSDLCAVYTQKYFGVRGSSPMVRPTIAAARISSTISQWNAWLTAPQRSAVFFRVMVRAREVEGGAGTRDRGRRPDPVWKRVRWEQDRQRFRDRKRGPD